MKTKNKFKTPVIKYDPIKQPKQPFWMHSVERPVSNNETKEVVLSFILLAVMAVVVVVLLMVLEG